VKIYHVIQLRFNRQVWENVHTITNVTGEYPDISKSFTYKMAPIHANQLA